VTPDQLQALNQWLVKTLQFQTIHVEGVARFPRTVGGMQKIDRQALRVMVLTGATAQPATSPSS
jgi:hypothetical protein